MKRIHYKYKGFPVEMPWNEDNEEIARNEADNGDYTVAENGLPDPTQEPTIDEILDAMLGVKV